MCILIFLSLSIISKGSVYYKNIIKKYLYEETLEFSSIKNFYNKYLGGIFPLDNVTNKTNQVFSEEITYKDITSYKDGAMLGVTTSYLIPAINGGIVVYIGEKEDYGNTIIIEDSNNIDIWYGNICNSTVKLYDEIEKGSYLGEACDDKIYLVYTKKNKVLDYKDYLE